MNPQINFSNHAGGSSRSVQSGQSSTLPQFSPLETLYVNSKKVSCDGGKGVSGHPQVYLNMGKNDFVICPYCSKYFTVKKRSSTQAIVGLKNQIKVE